RGPSRPGGSFFRDPKDHRHRAVIVGVGVGHAPVEVVVARRPVHRFLALIAVALAVAAAGFPAAIVVREDVIAAVGGVVTGADPGDRRDRGARRAGAGAAAAACAEKPVDGAVLPVLAVLGAIGSGRRLAGAWSAARTGQRSRRLWRAMSNSQISVPPSVWVPSPPWCMGT